MNGMITLVIVVAALFAGSFVLKGLFLSADSKQQELSSIMFNCIIEDGVYESQKSTFKYLNGRVVEPEDPPRQFYNSCNDIFEFVDSNYSNLSVGERHSRLAHALSMIRSQISGRDFERIRGLIVDYGARPY